MNLGTATMVVEPLLTGSVTETKNGNLVLATVTSIRTGTHHILVDTGGFNQQFALQQRLARLAPVTSLIVTHFHWDHCANVPLFPDVPIYAVTDPEWVDRVTLQEVQRMPNLVSVGEGDVVEGIARIWEVPGHTANHLAVAVRGDGGRVLITGDAIADVADVIRGEPSLIFYSKSQARRHVQRLVADADWIIPGHGDPFEVTHP